MLVWVVCLFVAFVAFDVDLRVFTNLDTLFNGCCLCRAFGRFDWLVGSGWWWIFCLIG